jgi:hypothetical protein
MGKHAANRAIRDALKARAKLNDEPILTIEFVVLRNGKPSLVERIAVAGDRLGYAEQTAKGMLDEVRLRHPKRPPDGFQVIDGDGAVVLSSWEQR